MMPIFLFVTFVAVLGFGFGVYYLKIPGRWRWVGIGIFGGAMVLIGRLAEFLYG